jgi:hypothetical protein
MLMLASLPRPEVLYIDGVTSYPTLDWYHFISRANTVLRNVRYLDLKGSVNTDTPACVCNMLRICSTIFLPCYMGVTCPTFVHDAGSNRVSGGYSCV